MYEKSARAKAPVPKIRLQELAVDDDDDDDPRCLSWNMNADDVDGTTVGTRRAVRWRTKSVHKGDHFIEPKKARLLNSVRRRDVDAVKRQLKEIKDGSDLTRVEDEFAVSVLEHAVRSGCSDVLDELLAFCDNDEERRNALDRAMLFAIKANDLKICRHIVRLHKEMGWCKNKETNGHVKSTSEGQSTSDDEDVILPGIDPMTAVRMRNNRKWSQPRSLSTMSLIDDSEFSQEMTPIVMAAQLERTEIIRLLIDECCPDIHPLTEIPSQSQHDKSSCYVCREQANFVGRQSIEECRKAIEVYKALSTPAYMFQAGVEDPILEAFVISDIMERRKFVDPAFLEEYDFISRRCKTLATDLLGQCRTAEEVSALLNHDGGIEKIHAKYHTTQFPRLMVASYYNQKEFIAHANCQQVLQNLWYEGLPQWVCQMDYHIVRTLFYVLLLTFCLPFILILYMFRVPFVDRFVRPPVSKFIFDVISYIVFLSFLFINASLERTHFRGGAPTEMEALIMIWLAGYTVRYARVIYRRRVFSLHVLTQSQSDLYQVIGILFFWVYFGLKVGLYVETRVKGAEVTSDRRVWPWYDPFLWCEVFYGVACAISVANLYSFFKASSMLGPLQISLKSMLFDVFRFLILFVVVLSAFAIALRTVYAGYTGYERINPDNPSDVRRQDDGFHSLPQTYKTLFWDLFGYGDVSDVDVVVGNVNVTQYLNDTTKTVLAQGPLVKHTLTEWVGFGLYGTYHMFVIIVLLNMLIAMMANSYNVVEKNSITEWRFARTRLILSYMNDLGVLVPPFNLLPIRFLLGLIVKPIDRCCKKDVDTSKFFVKTYKAVMDMISKRYWRYREDNLEKFTQRDRCRQRDSNA